MWGILRTAQLRCCEKFSLSLVAARTLATLARTDPRYRSLKSTADLIAKEIGVSERTVHRDAEYAEAVDTLVAGRVKRDNWKTLTPTFTLSII